MAKQRKKEERMKAARILGVVCLMGALGLGGCASFPAEEVPRTTMPLVSQDDRPSVYVDFRFYQGEPGAGAAEVPGAREAMHTLLDERFRNSGLFSRYTFDAAEKRAGDHVLKIRAYNHGSAFLAALSGGISGATLGIIPGTGKDEYTLTMETLDPAGNSIQNARNHDSVRFWIGWVILPLSNNTPRDALMDTMTRQIDALLADLANSRRLHQLAQR